MNYEPNKFELVELEFKHASEYYLNEVGRFQYAEIARSHVSMHVSIGMLNHNIVWGLYVTSFMKIHQREFFKYKVDIDM